VCQALTWCPWQPKLLASGDSSSAGTGTVRLWNVNSSYSHSNAAEPGKIEVDAQITSLQFSPHCKELLSTHGPGPSATDADSQISRPRKTMANSVVVHSYPSLRHVTTVSAAEKGVGDSALSPNGMKIVLAVPDESTLKVWDVWGKRKEIRRQPSFLERNSIR
jgi:cell division cycle protein 20 (cofactor of APC complex)